MIKRSIVLPHALVVLGFVLVSLFYFYPVLQGKKIYQSDIVQYTGMAKEQNDFRKSEGEEPYWTNAAFGGMPTYQLGAQYPHNYVKKLDTFLRFLPRPADYLFLYFLGFYILLCVLKIDPLKAFFGALAFGFSTYLIIILGVGHNAKAHAIAYMPMVVSGVILVFKKQWITGGLLTLFASALEIQANHFQMTYYLLILLVILSAYFVIQYVKKKDFLSLGKVFGVFMISGILAVGANAASLMATAEYADFSTRGKNELTINPEGEVLETQMGMSYDYITEYSYGKAESFNLIVPRLFGGSTNEKLGTDSHLYEFILSLGASHHEAAEFASQAPVYWGEQPIVAAPAYIGAVVFFFFILALFIEKRKIKYVFLAGAVLSLFLSWGKNFPGLTHFFIENVPLYNKFRAISSIQVILELCVPALAIMGFYSFFNSEKKIQRKALMRTVYVTLGIVVLLFLFKGSFSFEGVNDAYYLQAYGEIGPGFVDALVKDRKDLFTNDLMRTGGILLIAAFLLWLFLQQKLSQTLVIVSLGMIMVLDLVLIDKNYVNADSFVAARIMDDPFQPTSVDKEIIENEDDLHYRVFEVRGGMNNARASYFHKSLGGYSAVKPRRIQQLYDYHISEGNVEAMNMLNIKYLIQPGAQGEQRYSYNPFANGNAWFIESVLGVYSPDEEIRALDSLDTKKVAVINYIEYPEQADKYKEKQMVVDSTAVITLKEYAPNYLKYQSENLHDGLAVFSEVYYPHGWKVSIDGEPVEMFRVNYTLRALEIPAGSHTIEFHFDPDVVKRGGRWSLISSILILLLVAGGIFFRWKQLKAVNQELK